jgi:hypothetical protein
MVNALEKTANLHDWNTGHHIRAFDWQGLIARAFRGGSGYWRLRLLHIGNFAVQKCHLDVLVNVNLLAAQVEDFFRIAQSRLHLVGGHSQLNGLRLGRLWLQLRRLRGAGLW